MRGAGGYLRTGWILAGLAAVSAAVSIVALAVSDSATAGTVTGVVSMVAGVAGALAALRGGVRRAELTQAAMADQVAVAVRRRWEGEVQLRRVNDPYTIPVRWEPAADSLVADWAAVRLAARSVGWPKADQTRWAQEPAALAGGGDGDGIAEVLGRVPTGRLVVLGEPGAGKTILAVRLVLDLLAHRAPGEPVPVLVPLASWHPAREHLWDWLERRLCLEHPALRARVVGVRRVSWARALWDAGLLLPVLDGLDEITEQAHGQAITRLNEALRPGVGLVLTTRTGPYRAAVHPDNEATGVRLSAAAGVRLCPLDADVVVAYLTDSVGGQAGQARWGRVLTAIINPAHPVGQALVTPLMATLARTVYTPRPGEPAADLPDPTELLDRRLASRDAVERHLFDGFLPAAYRPHPDPSFRGPWQLADVQRWLTFLADHLNQLDGATDLAWWRLHTAVPRLLNGLAAGVVLGVGAGLLVGLLIRPLAGLLVSILIGLVFIPVGFVEAPNRPAQGLRWSPTRSGLMNGLLVGLASGLGFELAAGIVGGPVSGLAVGLTVALGVGLVTGLRPRSVEPTEAADPHTLLRRDRSTFRDIVLAFVLSGGLTAGLTTGLSPSLTVELTARLAMGLVGGLAAGLVVGLRGGLTVGVATGLATGLPIWFAIGSADRFAAGLAAGLVAGLVTGLTQTAWGWFVIARCWLAFRGRLPWRLMRFLTDAHQRGVLRQAGAAYQFRHAELQKHLAEAPSEDQKSVPMA